MARTRSRGHGIVLPFWRVCTPLGGGGGGGGSLVTVTSDGAALQWSPE